MLSFNKLFGITSLFINLPFVSVGGTFAISVSIDSLKQGGDGCIFSLLLLFTSTLTVTTVNNQTISSTKLYHFFAVFSFHAFSFYLLELEGCFCGQNKEESVASGTFQLVLDHVEY